MKQNGQLAARTGPTPYANCEATTPDETSDEPVSVLVQRRRVRVAERYNPHDGILPANLHRPPRANRRPANSRRHHHPPERPPLALDAPRRPPRGSPRPQGPRQGAQAARRDTRPADIGRAAVDTVAVLCDALEGAAADYALRDLGLEHSDALLEDEKTAHALFALLGDRDQPLRYSACVLLTSLLQNRPQKVQAYFLKAPVGPAPVIVLLEGEKEIVGHGERSPPPLFFFLLRLFLASTPLW